MNKKMTMMIAGLGFLFAGLFSAEDKVVIYGHISFIQEGVSVERGDGTAVEEVMINLPLAAGDIVATSDRSRCEIQGDNGTIIRLDGRTRIRFETVLAQGLTSNWKITTIHLLEGNLYIINNVYGKEMVQVITTDTAIRLFANSKTYVYLLPDQGTQLRVVSGRVDVMYGADDLSLSTRRLTRGNEVLVTHDNELVVAQVKDAEFFLWNEGLNQNFEAMHSGVSKLPKPIYRYPRAVIDWAERYSSIYGNWVFDEYFGYVWHPYQEQWATVSYSPFMNARWVRVGGVLYMVPQDPWGYVPVYLGLWHWNPKHGWIWIPGMQFHYDYNYPYMEFYLPFYDSFFPSRYRYFFGAWTLWGLYNYHYGYYDPYEYVYYQKNSFYKGQPPFKIDKKWLKNPKNIPSDIAKILQKIQALPESRRDQVLRMKDRPLGRVEMKPEIIRQLPGSASPKPSTVSPVMRVGFSASAGKEKIKALDVNRDWNPDARWSRRTGLEVKLRPETNEFACPKLGITASQVNSVFAKLEFRFHTLNRYSHGESGSASGSNSSGSSRSDGSSSASSTSSSANGASSSQGSANSSGEAKDPKS